jgi:signal transduction histidine kinase
MADSAKYYLKEGQDCLIIYDGVGVDSHRILSLLKANNGDYRGALEDFKKYHHLSDSTAKAGKTIEIARMKNWYELEQKDHENEILQQEYQKQQKLILILAVALTMIIALLTLTIFFYRKSAKKNRELKELHTVKDKLFSVVAHDLRHPISTLVSLMRLADAKMLDPDMQNQFIKDISNQVDDTFGLLDNLLCWSKSQMQGMAPLPTYFDAYEESRAVTDTLQKVAANKNIGLSNRIGQQQIFGDRDMFALVIRNLTMNAIKYTSEGGEVTLASELSEEMLIISVKDTGTGMSQEIQDNLFKLSETKSQYGTNNESGAGLGLVLCADFVKANGGRIWFISKHGEGSTFFFNIPTK